ncbi:MAG: M64 family metallopeptidase [Ignavibacteriaceae bacterium]
MKIIILLFICSFTIFAQVDFDKYFLDKTLRIDYFHTGNAENDSYSIDEVIEEPYWGGSKTNLVDIFNYGNYKFVVYDDSTNEIIYSRTYSTLFNEWQTIEEAKTTTKSFSETVVFPYPKNKVRVEFFSRDKKNNLEKKFEYKVDPENYFITTERSLEYPSFEIHNSGDPAKKVDIVILPEGYTEEEMDQFKEDCKRFTGHFFNSSPYKENKNNFNIWGVEAPSKQSGTDLPAKDTWKKTVLNSSFYSLNLERYLMTTDNKSVRDLAANTPYDIIYILVNSEIYGGGAIYNHYAVCVNKNQYEEYIFVHEFGHLFASLADEYVDPGAVYEDFYDLTVEPLDPNLTTLVDFDSKWKNLVDENIPIPTPATAEYKDKVGAFEGGGYVAKGIYRPKQDCTMRSISVDNFCPVCKNAIQAMIDFYTK